MLASLLRRLLDFLGENDYVYFTIDNRIFKPTQHIIHLKNGVIITLEEIQ